jgi:hypothetical protein
MQTERLIVVVLARGAEQAPGAQFRGSEPDTPFHAKRDLVLFVRSADWWHLMR